MNDTQKLEQLCRDMAVVLVGESGWCKIHIDQGRVFVSGLGVGHAQGGFPLCLSLDLAAERGLLVCLMTTERELVRCGVAGEKAKGVVIAALNEVLQPIPDKWRLIRSNRQYLEEIEKA